MSTAFVKSLAQCHQRSHNVRPNTHRCRALAVTTTTPRLTCLRMRAGSVWQHSETRLGSTPAASFRASKFSCMWAKSHARHGALGFSHPQPCEQAQRLLGTLHGHETVQGPYSACMS